MAALWEITSEAIGLRGFIRDLGQKLEDELTEQFRELVVKHKIRVWQNSDKRDRYFVLGWSYNGWQYNFSGEFSIEQEDLNSPMLTIDRYLGVRVKSNSNLAIPTADPEELRTAADMENFVTEFLKMRFGDPIKKRGNGCPIYEAKLSEKSNL